MSAKPVIRASVPPDQAAIEALYPAAFPDEDLLPLVRDLLHAHESVLSLIATIDSEIVGHVLFTKCTVAGTDNDVSLLAPLAVAPARQRQGIGSSLVPAGLQRLEDYGVELVCVLGDPAYYGRLGFLPETDVEPPYQLPAEWAGAWQSKRLGENASECAGRLVVPLRWQREELWLP